MLYIAAYSETLKPMAVYRALYGEHVIRDGVKMRRFTYISAEETR